MERACKVCNKPLKGRIDKKYCDDTCRNKYNNDNRAIRSPHDRKLYNIKRMLNSLDNDKQRQVVWERVVYLVDRDNRHLAWIMKKLETLIKEEGDKLLSPFQ